MPSSGRRRADPYCHRLSHLALSLMFSFGLATRVVADDDKSAPPKRLHHTYPQPPRAAPADPRRVNPGWVLPPHPEAYTWRLSDKTPDGKPLNPPVVAVYKFERGHRIRVGDVPAGTEIKLETVRSEGGQMYYGLALPGTTPKDAAGMTWVSGLNVEPVSYAPVVQ